MKYSQGIIGKPYIEELKKGPDFKLIEKSGGQLAPAIPEI